MNAGLDRLARLPREARDTLFLLAIIAWIVLPQVAALPPWCTALVALVILWRGTLALGSRPLPGRWWLLALLLGVTVATRITHGSLLGQEAGVTMVVSLLALKTLELRARRDALVIFFLGFFTLLTGLFRSQSILTALVMLLGVLGLLTALVNAHRPVGVPRLRESAALALRMALAGAPVMIALFVFFPRFAPLWGMPTDGLSGRSGLSPTMQVGKVAELALSEGIALRARFEGLPPAQSELYFRGPVLSHFDGREWAAFGGSGGASFGPPPQDLKLRGAPIRYDITLEPNQQPWLLTLDATPAAPELPERWRARLTPELQWVANRPVTELLRYRVESWPRFSYGQDEDGPRARQQLRALRQLPAGFNPRTLALAEQLRAAADSEKTPEQAIVQAALQRLRTGGYQYTLSPGVSGRDSADEFWFDRKAGFCEHIASAFVILMRAAGIPARIVTGYQGGEQNGIDGYWVVRNADAHAWAEVWLASQGWLRVDPTGAVMPGRIGQLQRLRPPPGIVEGTLNTLNPDLLRQLRATWEAINNGWNQSILNYTQNRQLDLLRKLGFDQPSLEDLVRILAALLALVALGAVAWARLENRRHDPWLRLLTRARADLQAAGIAAPRHVPPRELAGLVAASTLPQAQRARLAGWLLALERQRYAPDGQGQGRGKSVATLRREYRQIRWTRRSA